MASIKFDGLAIDYLALFNLLAQMKIPGHAPLRAALNTRVQKTWPEVFAPGGIKAGHPLQKEKRSMEISLEEQSALGHGFWGIYNEEVLDAVRNTILDLSKLGKVSISGWLNKKIAELPPLTDLVTSDEIMGDVVPDSEQVPEATL
jgi:hypothetical protein